jgi:hypothetical protein
MKLEKEKLVHSKHNGIADNELKATNPGTI